MFQCCEAQLAGNCHIHACQPLYQKKMQNSILAITREYSTDVKRTLWWKSALAVLFLFINTPARETRGNSSTKCPADDAGRYSGSSKVQPWVNGSEGDTYGFPFIPFRRLGCGPRAARQKPAQLLAVCFISHRTNVCQRNSTHCPLCFKHPSQ